MLRMIVFLIVAVCSAGSSLGQTVDGYGRETRWNGTSMESKDHGFWVPSDKVFQPRFSGSSWTPGPRPSTGAVYDREDSPSAKLPPPTQAEVQATTLAYHLRALATAPTKKAREHARADLLSFEKTFVAGKKGGLRTLYAQVKAAAPDNPYLQKRAAIVRSAERSLGRVRKK